ncbi:MAG: hypothetical protein AB4050_19000 [Synechococcus sp.]
MTSTDSISRTLIHLTVGGLLAMALLTPQSYDRSRLRRSANFSRCQQTSLLGSLTCRRANSRARHLGSR